jgi:NAD-dependent dihydropyrimidine dehydrogenase PreA subunit
MCEFCTKHGDGQVWFKNAANYAKSLIADLERRKYIAEFLNETMGKGILTIGRLETIYRKKGHIPPKIKSGFVDQAKTDHFGQVVTIEDVEEIVSKAATVVRLPCACKWASSRKESRTCYSVSYTPDTWFEGLDMGYFGLPQHEGLERVTPEAAIEQIRQLGQDGAVHSIWTMKTPFIGAICNCEPADCLGLRTLFLDMQTMYKGESVARVDADACVGCGDCETVCRFNAVHSHQISGEYKSHIHAGACHGCGNCRHQCPQDAISMIERPADLF